MTRKFIIALCPASKVYLVKYDVPANRIFSPHAATVATETTRVKGEAALFETFEAAMELCADITGWGGAQRVEEVEVPDTRVTLDTPEARIAVRDAATSAYTDADDGTQREPAVNAAAAVAQAMRSLGLKVATIVRPDSSCAVTVNLADHLGNLLTLDWDPMQDGFSYETEGDDACDIGETEAQHEDEPCPEADPDCECCGGTGVRVTHYFGDSLLGSTSDCECTTKAETATCDGCGSTDAEPCGDSEGFAFCAACRAEDSITADDAGAFLQGYLAAAVWASTPLTEIDEDDRSLERRGYSVEDLCETSLIEAKADCDSFIRTNATHLARALAAGIPFSSLGHDFFLSRNGHGAGFFDRVGPTHCERDAFNRLQVAAKVYGPTDQVEENTDGTITIR